MNKTNSYGYKNYYYLLYKLRKDPILWIVDESINKDDLLYRIKNINSKEEIYYIVSKKYSQEYIKDILDTKFFRFQKFKVDQNCKIEYNTE